MMWRLLWSLTSVAGTPPGSNAVGVCGDALRVGTPSLLQGKRIMVAITSFDFEQLVHLERMLDGVRDMCEAGASPEILVYSVEAWPSELQQILSHRLFCYRTGASVVMKVVLLPRSVRLHLANHHRKDMYLRLQDFDLFVYAENDLLISASTVAAFLAEERALLHCEGAPTPGGAKHLCGCPTILPTRRRKGVAHACPRVHAV